MNGACRGSPTPSPRFQLIQSWALELATATAEHDAHGLELCGSVTRGTGDDCSDVDLFVRELRSGPESTSELER
jgi:predicted nucleotidyltransferase